MPVTLAQRLAAEFVGSSMLLATVVGSGIMAEALAGGNIAVALLGNTIPTGAMLVVLITMLGPISGAHFNPAVTLVFRVKGEISNADTLAYITVQLAGALCGVLLAHLMFDLPILQASAKVRTGNGQWVSEAVATFGLVFTILATRRFRPETIPMAVGLYITAAYWFTASTSFANPAVTVARAFSNSFAGIRPADVPGFVLAQIAGAGLALLFADWLLATRQTRP
ncbi:aquaporin family protein [Agrobacterium sp. a22-2]|uniref:aquaporin n=1 Tax=Agrobacterium sp. a22-2 TaxID=2283840 RepID=UPI001447B686|nr:MIP/aquaporin family protein [Agrobacterium sp. a22-2]NKN36600.1 aquaporin family protein [Agrobacterium sp. a22-2]